MRTRYARNLRELCFNLKNRVTHKPVQPSQMIDFFFFKKLEKEAQ